MRIRSSPVKFIVCVRVGPRPEKSRPAAPESSFRALTEERDQPVEAVESREATRQPKAS